MSDEVVVRAQEVAKRIADRRLRTVRLIVVDQHGIPRAKYLSGAALAALRERLRLLRRDLQPGHRQRRVPAGVRRRRRLRHRRDDRLPRRDARSRPDDVPDPAVREPHGLDPVRRVLRERQADAARRPRAPAPPARPPRRARADLYVRPRGRAVRDAAGAPVGRLRRDGAARLTRRRARGRGDRARLPVPLGQPHGRHRRHARGDPGRARRRRPAAALDRERVGPGADRDHVQPDGGPRRGRRDDPLPQHRQGGLRAPGPARRRSCAGRRFRTSSRAAGTCTSR